MALQILTKICNEKSTNLREAYSRRESLIITGIREAQNAPENTLEVLQDFIANELNVSDAANIDFHRVHRLARPSHKGPRAIIARFLKYPDKERILSLGKHLRDKDFFMFSDYPEEIQRSRKRQLKKLKDAKQAGKRLPLARAGRICYTSMDSLFLNKLEQYFLRLCACMIYR